MRRWNLETSLRLSVWSILLNTARAPEENMYSLVAEGSTYKSQLGQVG